MPTDGIKPTSVPHDEWSEIGKITRLHLQKRVHDMPKMTPSELHDFMKALKEAELFEMVTSIWDLRRDDWADSLRKGY